MSLERKAIRQAAVLALKGRTRAGDKVKDTESDPFRPSVQAPATLGVYTMLDQVDLEASVDSPRFYLRDVELAVEAWVEEGLTGKRREDLLDDLTDQVERVLAGLVPRLHRAKAEGRPLEIHPSKSYLSRTELGYDRQGRALLGAARVVYVVRYGAPERQTDCGDILELDGLDVRWDFAPPDFVVEARDEIREPGG